MANEIPGQTGQSEEIREALRSELEQLPEPVRVLYERARGLFTGEPGFDFYDVDVGRFSRLLLERGISLTGVNIESIVVFVYGGKHAEYPELTAGIIREGEVSPNGLVGLSTRGLIFTLHRDEETGVLISGSESQNLNKEQVTVLAFTEALLDSLEGVESDHFFIYKQTRAPTKVRLDTSLFKRSIFYTQSQEPEIGFSSMTDEERKRIANEIVEAVRRFGQAHPHHPPSETPGDFVKID